MDAQNASDLNRLIGRASRGDDQARRELLSRYRDRLHRMVAARLDRRLAPRLDPSDVVQEALTVASLRLEGCLRDRPVSFYPWLRQITCERLIDLRRRHLVACQRSVLREAERYLDLPEESAVQLVDRLAAGGSTASQAAIRNEIRDRVRDILMQLCPHDREILVLRTMEGLSVAEAAEVLGHSEEGVKSRHRRALERFRRALDASHEGGPS
jgi:RNA polymerase sigma-70 factor (ECF subfamily)